MVAKVSFAALFLVMVYYVTPNACDVAYAAPVVMNLPPSIASYWPGESPYHNDLKKSLYTMGQALSNVNFNAQSYYDYYHLNKYSPLYMNDLLNRQSKMGSAESFMTDAYTNYMNALANYKNSLGYTVPAPKGDDVPLTPVLFTSP